jgi:hypothetical protein
MTEAMIDDLLDELVPAVEQLPDWDGVLRRAIVVRRRRVLTAAAVVALLMVPTAYAIARAFEGTPGPPQIRQSFTQWNGMADMANKHGFKMHVPHAIVATAHGVLQLRTSDGLLDLWAARSTAGGICWFVDYEADVRPGRPVPGGGTCDQTDRHPPKIDYELGWTRAHPTLQTLAGRVYVRASSVRVLLSSGATVHLPVVEGLFLASVPNHVHVRRIVALDARGREVASFRV